MTTAQDQQSRAEFERLAVFIAEPGLIQRDAEGYYMSTRVQGMWIGWLAARALPAGMEPMFWVRLRSDGCYEGPLHNESIEKVRRTSGAWAPLYLGAPPRPVAQKRYRLLVRNVDTIQADDEFLRDADSTWQIDPQGIFVGMPYMSNVLLPARRAIEPTP